VTRSDIPAALVPGVRRFCRARNGRRNLTAMVVKFSGHFQQGIFYNDANVLN
jgi:hypothetical protein